MAAALGPAGSLAQVPFQYRATRYTVPQSFFRRWLDDYSALRAIGSDNIGRGLVSAPSDAIRTLWPMVDHDDRATPSIDFYSKNVTGCFDIPDHRGLFWHSGTSPSRRVWGYGLKLVSQHWTSVEKLFDGAETPCTGMGAFIATLLSGGSTTNNAGRSDDRRCTLMMHVMGPSDDRKAYGSVCATDAEQTRCNEGYWPERGCDRSGTRAFDDYSYSELEALRRFTVDPGKWGDDAFDDVGRGPVPAYKGDCGYAHAYGSSTDLGFQIFFQAAQIHWLAELVDYLLFWSRVALDYSRLAGSAQHLMRARQLAGYGLRSLLRLSRTAVHEFGHLYTGLGGHCEDDSCFDVAAMRFECAVRAVHGLPHGAWSPEVFLHGTDTVLADYPNQSSQLSNTQLACKSNSGKGSYYAWGCDVGTVGAYGSDSRFAAIYPVCESQDKCLEQQMPVVEAEFGL